MTVRDELLAWVLWPVREAPGSAGIALRRQVYRMLLGTAGHFRMEEGVRIVAPQNVHLADDVGIMRGTAIFAQDGECRMGARTSVNTNVHLGAAGGTLVIGKNVLIGPNVVLRAADHVFADPGRPIRDQGHAGGTIVIEDDVWLGANVVVTRNVRIGRGAVVGAGAVVTRDVPALAIVVGVSARVVGVRGEASTSEFV